MCYPALLGLPLELLESISWHIQGDSPSFTLSPRLPRSAYNANPFSSFSSTRRDLSSFTRVSRLTRQASEKVLYRSIELVIRKQNSWSCGTPPPGSYDKLHIYNPVSRFSPEDAHFLPPAASRCTGGDLHLLLRTLRSRPDLAQAVRIAALQPPQYTRPQDLVHSDLFAAAILLLSLCPNLCALYTPYLPPTSITSFGLARSLPRLPPAPTHRSAYTNPTTSPSRSPPRTDTPLYLPYLSSSFVPLHWAHSYLSQLRFTLPPSLRLSFLPTRCVALSGSDWARGPVRFLWQALAECLPQTEELRLSKVRRNIEPPEAWLAIAPYLPGGEGLRKLVLEETELLSLPPPTGSWLLRDLPKLEVVECLELTRLEPFSFLLLPPSVGRLTLVNHLPHTRFPSSVSVALYGILGLGLRQIRGVRVTSGLPGVGEGEGQKGGRYARWRERCREVGVGFELCLVGDGEGEEGGGGGEEVAPAGGGGPPWLEKFDVFLRPVPWECAIPQSPVGPVPPRTVYPRKRYGLL